MKRNIFMILFVVTAIIIMVRCSGPTADPYAAHLDSSAVVYGPYKVLKLPIAKGVAVTNPIQISMGPGELLYAANQSGEVYTLRDSDGDGLEDEAVLYCNVRDAGLKSPGGFTFRGDTVFIGTSQEIRAYVDLNKDGRADSSWTFFNDIPHSEHPYEWTSGMNFGSDGSLYCAITTDSWNVGASADPKGYRGAILRISPDGKTSARMATGIRSVYGMAFNPEGDLFFADNAGGGNPNEELNLMVPGKFYGHNPKKHAIGDTTLTGPAFLLKNEVAPSGIVFNASNNDFGGTAGDLFVAYYGPGERWKRGAVSHVRIIRKTDGSYSYEEFPVADIPKLSDLAFGKDGSLYVSHHGISDYWYNANPEKTGGFFKLIYDGSVKGKPAREAPSSGVDLAAGSVEAGRKLFGIRACAGCHAVDGTTELLGPNLKGIGAVMSREELLQDIQNPSARIKPSMGGVKVYTKDGKMHLGRVVTADEKEISLMLVGNTVVRIQKSDIAKTEDEQKSLMYEKLLNNMPKEELESLLDYIVSLR